MLRNAQRMNPQAKAWEERWPEVRGLVEKGESIRRIAEILGITYGSVNRVIQKARKMGEPELIYAETQRHQAYLAREKEMLEMPMKPRWRKLLELRQSGRRMLQVEIQMNITKQRIYQILQQIKREYWKWKWEQAQKEGNHAPSNHPEVDSGSLHRCL